MTRGRIEPTISLSSGAIDWRAGPPRVERQPDRPLLLSLLALLLVTSGIGIAFLLLDSWRELSAAGAASGLGAAWPVALALLAGLSVFAGLLLFSGAPLGWYLAVLILADAALAAVPGLLEAHARGVPLALWDGGTLSGYAKDAGGALLGVLLIAYFFTAPVRRSCSVSIWSALICLVSSLLVGIVLVVLCA